MNRIVLKEGIKIVVVKGTNDIKDRPTNKALWIAGEVPVGTIGTLYKHPINAALSAWAIRFEGIEPKFGYYFSLGFNPSNIYLSDTIAEVAEAATPVAN